jgi:ketosteroid isomerase-like protein
MSLELNRQVAKEFLTTMRDHGGLDASLITDDFQWWASYHHGVMNCSEIKATVASISSRMPQLPEMTVVGTTAEGERVAVELSGKCELADGTRYDNTYHFVILLREGRVRMVREYSDTKLASDAFGGLDLVAVTRSGAGQAV